MLHRLLFIFSAWITMASSTRAENWPAWRGPRGDGTSLETGIPIRWSQTENLHWKIAIRGRGHSSPIIWGDRVFLTSCLEKEEQRILICLDRRDGKTLWERVVLSGPFHK